MKSFRLSEDWSTFYYGRREKKSCFWFGGDVALTLYESLIINARRRHERRGWWENLVFLSALTCRLYEKDWKFIKLDTVDMNRRVGSKLRHNLATRMIKMKFCMKICNEIENWKNYRTQNFYKLLVKKMSSKSFFMHFLNF